MQFTTLSGLLEGFHAARILVLGDVMLDRFVYGSVERISPEAPIPVVNVDRIMDMPGGAANVARNIAALGARAILLGVVGDDLAALDLTTQLAASPTIEPHLIADASRPTSVKTRYVADGQQVMRADRESRTPLAPAVERRVLDDYIAALRDADAVVLSDYAKGVLSDSMARAAIDAARSAGKTVIVDPKAKNLVRYRGASILTPNRLELQQAYGGECVTDDEIAAAAMSMMGQDVCDVMVVTRGKDGMSIICRDRAAVHLPTSARQVFDVSGAGDTVVATLSLGLAAGGDVVQACTLANMAAGLVVGKRGTATVTSGEVVAALAPLGGRADPQKIFAVENALQLARSWRDQGLKIAFTNGCFDLLHVGHVTLLEDCHRFGSKLVLGLNSDASVRRLKGPTRPVVGEKERTRVMAALAAVDAVVLFEEDTPIELIRAVKPDVLVKGGDYSVETVVGHEDVIAAGGRVEIVPTAEGFSTTNIVRRLRE